MFQWWSVGVLVGMVGATSSQYLTNPGDIMLGGLFPIHKQGEHGLTCGGIQDEDGIQPLEALLFTLDEINADSLLLPNIKLGVIVLDTCDNPLHGAEQVVDLLQGFMYRKVKTLHSDVVCSNNTIKNILGLIGGQTSEVSLEIARLGRIFRVPQAGEHKHNDFRFLIEKHFLNDFR